MCVCQASEQIELTERSEGWMTKIPKHKFCDSREKFEEHHKITTTRFAYVCIFSLTLCLSLTLTFSLSTSLFICLSFFWEKKMEIPRLSNRLVQIECEIWIHHKTQGNWQIVCIHICWPFKMNTIYTFSFGVRSSFSFNHKYWISSTLSLFIILPIFDILPSFSLSLSLEKIFSTSI